MADKLRTTQQLEALQNKYVGTGHADTTRFEWTSNIQRDSLASYVGHPPLLSYMTLAMGEGTREEMRVKLIEKMVRPVGAPPEVCVFLFCFSCSFCLLFFPSTSVLFGKKEKLIGGFLLCAD
jgi:splicing factor 3B subunit 5